MRRALEGEGVDLERVEERMEGREGGMRQRRDNKEGRPPPSKSGMAQKGGGLCCWWSTYRRAEKL